MVKNDNKAMRTGVILAVIAIITMIALCATFAKYAVSGSGSDSARVARWGLNMSDSIEVKLFNEKYTSGGNTIVDASDDASVIAPGTSGSDTITIASFTGTEAPEVRYAFNLGLSVDQSGGHDASQVKTELNRLITAGQFKFTATYLGSTYTCDGTTTANKHYATIDSWVSAINNDANKTYEANTMPGSTATHTIDIAWEWNFTDKPSTDASTKLDTEIANNEAIKSLGEFVVKVAPSAAQVNS